MSPDATLPGAGSLAQIDLVSASFLSGSPDVATLDRQLEQLSYLARVDPESVEYNPGDGSTRGKLVLPGEGMSGTFELKNGVYRVALDSQQPPTPDDRGYVARNIVMFFGDQQGLATEARTLVQFHPDMNRPSSLPGDGDGERIVGWLASIGNRGMSAVPYSVSHLSGEMGWRVGPSETLADVSEAWNTSVAAHESWLRMLKPFARHP